DGVCNTAQGEANAGGDCNDANPTIFPGATDVPGDGVDQDCSGSDAVVCFVDGDGDGGGTSATLVSAAGDCAGPGESSLNTDCNDANPAIFPGATDIPDDGVDQNCNGADTITCIVDADHDGSGTSAATTILAGDGVCDPGQGEADHDGDCNDSDPSIFPGAT